jgi:hypothetical protein
MRYPIIFSVVVLLLLMNGPLNGQPRPKAFVPFRDFLESSSIADSGEYLARSTSRVKDAYSFEQMRQHILRMYEGVEVDHSFVLNSDHFDCVQIEQQPSVRLLGLRGLASPPPDSVLSGRPPSEDAISVEPATRSSLIGRNDQFDEFGNSIGCEEHTIPMRRITLEELTRFKTLKQFFEKGPHGAGHPPGLDKSVRKEGHSEPPPDLLSNHKHAYTIQWVNNLGGNSALNYWRPSVHVPLSEIFSLSQQWYFGGSGASLQTVEGGWHNFPGRYGGSENSRLFIYWTANGYNGTGCYNLDCPGFIQINNSWCLGCAFSTYSTWGGPQYDFDMKWYLYAGNWWLSLGNQWIGYYPGTIYRGGQLTRYAQGIEYGGETDAASSFWPPMGSGGWASYAFGHAAYQRDVFYFDTASNPHWASLRPVTESPRCYSAAGPYWGGSSGWSGSGIYFYFGGPGGSGC